MVLIGDGPKGGLQGASSLDDMLQYCLPYATPETFYRKHNFDKRLYEAILVEGEFRGTDDAALEEMLLRAKSNGAFVVVNPAIKRRGAASSEVEYQYSAFAIRRSGVSIVKG